MYLINCMLCSNQLKKEDNLTNNKYICSNINCDTHFEVMDVKNDGQEEKIVKYYKVNNKAEMISHCAHCKEELVKRCSMPTIGTRGKKVTTILTCSNSNCNSEYHVTDIVELKEKYESGDLTSINFRTIEIY